MRYPAKETATKHDRIVKEASRLFREPGFDNVTVAEVMKGRVAPHEWSTDADEAKKME